MKNFLRTNTSIDIRKISFVAICLINLISRSAAQEKETLRLDLLKAPNSPAAQLLGFAVSEIDKPTDLAAFMLSIRSASSSMSKLPNSYAIDLAPFSLIRGDTSLNLTGTNSLQSTDFRSVVRQSMVVSFALRNPDTTLDHFNSKNMYAAVGLKFSIVRPRFSHANESILNQISLSQGMLLDLATRHKQEARLSEEYKVLQQQKQEEIKLIRIRKAPKTAGEFQDVLLSEGADPNSRLNKIENDIKNLILGWNNEILDNKEAQAAMAKIKTLAAQFDAVRVGFSWDVAGGIGLNFRDKRFDNSKVYNSGIWTTLGYNFEKSGSLLAVGRLMFNPDQIYALGNTANPFSADIHTFDAGARYVFTKNRFGCSLEGIYRSIINTSVIDPSWRVVFNTDYTIAPNQKLLFSFGRNFDGSFSKNNNLIASLSLLFGFGGTKI